MASTLMFWNKQNSSNQNGNDAKNTKNGRNWLHAPDVLVNGHVAYLVKVSIYPIASPNNRNSFQTNPAILPETVSRYYSSRTTEGHRSSEGSHPEVAVYTANEEGGRRQ